jgi:single-strand DNA-binding protein
MYINQVTLYGNLTRDPELKALPSGMNVCGISIATNRKWKDKDGKPQEATEYHNVVAFGKQADLIAQYLTKGSPIYVMGRLQTRTWDKDGQKQYRTEVVVETFQFGPKGSTAGQKPANSSQSKSDSVLPEYPEEEINPQDIPF